VDVNVVVDLEVEGRRRGRERGRSRGRWRSRCRAPGRRRSSEPSVQPAFPWIRAPRPSVESGVVTRVELWLCPALERGGLTIVSYPFHLARRLRV